MKCTTYFQKGQKTHTEKKKDKGNEQNVNNRSIYQKGRWVFTTLVSPLSVGVDHLNKKEECLCIYQDMSTATLLITAQGGNNPNIYKR